MECKFLIKLKDDDKLIEYVPKSLEKTNKDVFFFDYFVYVCRYEENFYKNIKALINTDKEIEKVSIDYERNDDNRVKRPYSILFGNGYINTIMKEGEPGKFKYIKCKTINVYGEKKEQIYVDPESKPFKDMWEYVKEYLEEDSETFFKSIYNYKSNKGKFTDDLSKYVQLYQNEDMDGMEGVDELRRVSKSIQKQLSNYDVFRKMAKCRWEYEMRDFNKDRKQAIKEGVYGNIEYEYNDNNLAEYNMENDEFIENSEYSQMVDGEGIIRR